MDYPNIVIACMQKTRGHHETLKYQYQGVSVPENGEYVAQE